MIENAIRALNLINERARKARDYGTGDALFHAEVHMLVAIHNHPEANASDLAKTLGITSGAVTQVVRKLKNKQLVEQFQQIENRKAVFFRLTAKGAQVYRGHEQAENRDFRLLMEYLDSCSAQERATIRRFFDCLTRCLRSG